MTRTSLRIGAVAAGAGVNIQTLRYYERRGLFDTPARNASGYREYRPETVALVRAIKRAQRLGFRLAEIEGLVRLRESRASPAKVRSAADAKLREIDDKIRALRTMRRALQRLVETCACGGDLRRCKILDGLDDDPRSTRIAGVTPTSRSARAGRRSP